MNAVEAVTRELAHAHGASSASFLIADLSGRALVRLARTSAGSLDPGRGERRDEKESATVLPFDGGPAEQALRTQSTLVLGPDAASPTGAAAGEWTVLAPVTERGEALGLLEMVLPVEPGPALLDEISRTAHLLSFVLIANRRHTDLFEWGQRSTPFTMSAEIQRRLLPSAFTCEGGAFTLSAWLEPASSIGGDTYDYSVGRDTLFLSMTDAMGHGLNSALTATVCVGSLRNTRRQATTLLEQAEAANAALVEYAETVHESAFATGMVGRLTLSTGVLSIVNAGHTGPYLARDGAVTMLDLPADVPFGMFADSTYRSTDLALRAGDRLVIVTDGMLERNASSLDLCEEIAATRELHPREATRALADRVIAASGSELADDAALFVLDWHGQQDNTRTSHTGADTAGTDAAGHPTGPSRH
ncbi:PP2C family protein-serine/threonine phosphatase [Kineococcus xinjiangensis]|uniref:PP2C family protein-serine/threonine phosphatase n=1 Tax=Kineococcus xinjiangensis TaxID=512762 RepID=UPI001B80AC9E|nr:PP2C family protein-serine/threonine phosphatase [Kineococcus xinjiangensis]